MMEYSRECEKSGQETLQKIEDTFVTLLQEKALHEVEVSEICELTQINCSTFCPRN